MIIIVNSEKLSENAKNVKPKYRFSTVLIVCFTKFRITTLFRMQVSCSVPFLGDQLGQVFQEDLVDHLYRSRPGIKRFLTMICWNTYMNHQQPLCTKLIITHLIFEPEAHVWSQISTWTGITFDPLDPLMPVSPLEPGSPYGTNKHLSFKYYKKDNNTKKREH